MAAGQIAIAFRELSEKIRKAESALYDAERTCEKEIGASDKDAEISTAIIKKILAEVKAETLKEKTKLNYRLHKDLCRIEYTAAIKKLVTKQLERFGFKLVVECSHDFYRSEDNQKDRFIDCDMSMVRCAPKMYLSW